MKTKIASLIITLLLTPFFALAAENAAKQYYSFSVNWNSQDNTLALSGDVSLTKKNILQDSGAGSQFYARVINPANYARVFEGGDSKLFLGKWQAGADPKKTEQKITVPHFSNGMRVIIFDAKDKKAKLTVNVMKFAKFQKPAQSAAAQKNSFAAQTPVAQTYLIGGHSAAYWWTWRIVILLLFVGGGYFLWRWIKKRKEAKANNIVNITQSKK